MNHTVQSNRAGSADPQVREYECQGTTFRHRVPFLLMLALLAPASIFGQNVPSENSGQEARTRFGGYGHVNLNLHSAGFSALPGVPNCCPEYESGFGIGPTLGLLFETPLSSQLMLSLRGGYSVAGATLARDEETTVEQDGEAVPMTIEHTLESSLANIGLEPLIGLRLGNGLMLMGGTRVGYGLGADYAQMEKISDETLRGTFENGQRSRHESEGEIPGASAIQASLLAGASYEMPLNPEGTLLAVPELFFSYGITPVSGDVTWNAHALRGGIAVKYSPRKHPGPPPMPPADPVVPTPPVAVPVLAARVSASGVDADGTEHPTVRLQVEEFIATESYPLLNYIFFDENSSELSERYVRLNASETGSFSPTELQGVGALRVYRQLLNLVGVRMRNDPSARLRLVGTNADMGEESRNTDLSRARAENVREYLRDVWGIAEGRMQIEERNLPASPSNTGTGDGQSENRRVELQLISGNVLAPVVIEDTLRRATPPVVRFRPEVTSEAGVASWEITAMQDERTLKRLSGIGDVPERIDWAVDAESETMPHAPGRMFYSLSVIDETGQAKETVAEAIDVEQITVRKKRNDRTADVEIKRYSLILFGYDESRLSAEHGTVLRQIGEEISPDARVIVRGYADRTGDDARNRALSRERAETVARALGLEGARVEVRGELEPLYDNDIPEGRFYSRTVTIEVRTPMVDGDSG